MHRHIHVQIIPALFAAALTALSAVSAGAQSSTRHTTASKTASGHRSTTTKKPSTKKATSGTAAASMAGAWRSVYSDNEVAVSLDTVQTKKLPDGTYNARLKWQYATDKPIGRQETYRTLVEHRLLNCTFFGSKPMTAQTFDVSGKPVSSFTTSARDIKYMDWGVRKGGTSASKAYAALCTTLQTK